MKMKKMKFLRVFVIAFAVAMVLGTTTTVFAVPWSDPSPDTTWYKMQQIQRGSLYGSGTVRGCQLFLGIKGYSLGSYGIDGDFGATTYNAVTSFQYDNNLYADGIVGRNTWAKMRSQIGQSDSPGSTNYPYSVTNPVSSGYNNYNPFLHKHTNNEPQQSSGGINSWWESSGYPVKKMCN